MKNHRYALDSNAMLVCFQAESGGKTVRSILKDAIAGSSAAFLPIIISLGEIYYIIARKRGDDKACKITELIPRLSVAIAEATKEYVLAAARVKARDPLSYTDAFVVATAAELAAMIVSG